LTLTSRSIAGSLRAHLKDPSSKEAGFVWAFPIAASAVSIAGMRGTSPRHRSFDIDNMADGNVVTTQVPASGFLLALRLCR
jgi:hypothetical protein